MKSVFAVISNTDLTEGRGYKFSKAICEQKITANRLAKGAYVMGSDAPVEEIPLREIDGVLYIPIKNVNVISPSKEDRANLEKFESREKLIKKLLDAGILEEDLKILNL